MLIAEFTIINLACRLAYYLRFSDFGEPPDLYLYFFVTFNLAWIGASLFNNAYDTRKLVQLEAFAQSFFTTLFMQVFLVLAFIVGVKADVSREFLLYTYFTGVPAILCFRAILLLAYRYYNNMTYTIRKIAIVGNDTAINELYDFFDAHRTNVYRFLADLDPKLSQKKRDKIIQETLEDLKGTCLQEGINEVYVSLPLVSEEIIQDMADFADDNFIYFRMVTDFAFMGRRPLNVEFFGHIPILSLRKEPLSTVFNQSLKRIFDIAFSLFIIVLVFPVLYPIVALAIKLESKGPVLFKQLRSGKSNQEFLCYKFRTMTVNEEAEEKQAAKNDQRVTKVGRWLRRTSLDEFPQFFNVLKGDMSVVGPRPHMLKHTDEYGRSINKYLFRHFITPGITGHAQVNGYRGETADPELMRKRIEYDTWYIENWSFLLDLKIILLTVWNVLRGEERAY